MKILSRDEVQEKIQNEKRVLLVEVLNPIEYKDYHLPGAINVPLSDDFEIQIQKAVPDKTTPVILYCKDAECQASPNAARRMDELGYTEVYDYEGGKVDWKVTGLEVA